MPINKEPLSSVVEQDLQALILGGSRESRTLEFKREIYGGDDRAREEFLADVSSLANTLGGDLVLGMDETDGVATDLPGLPQTLNLDTETLRMTQMLQAGLQPRLPEVAFHPVPLASGAVALVIRVRRSFNGPHRVVFKGKNRFWARSDAGRYEPDVDELRRLFSAAPMLAERLREMRADRVAAVLAGDVPVPMIDERGVLILHVIPFSAAEMAPASIDLGALVHSPDAWVPWGGGGYNNQKNFNGWVTYTGHQGPGSRAYVQVFRSGMVEVVARGVYGSMARQSSINAITVARHLMRQVTRTIGGLRDASMPGPYAVQFTIAGVLGATFFVPPHEANLFPDTPLPLARDVLSFVDAIVDETCVAKPHILMAIRPIIDQVFYAASMPWNPFFNGDGTPNLVP